MLPTNEIRLTRLIIFTTLVLLVTYLFDMYSDAPPTIAGKRSSKEKDNQ